MNSYDVRRLGRIYALVVKMEAMKIANLIRENKSEAPAYAEIAFIDMQTEFENMAYCHDEQL